MGKIFIIIGKSATGKDTIYRRIVSEQAQQVNEIIMYTTRPIRSNEKDGEQYYFVSEGEYLKLKQENKIIEERAYDTIYGIWRYFTVADGQFEQRKNHCIMMGTLESYIAIRDYFGAENVIPIYIEVENGLRLERALGREKAQKEPKYTELCRRFLADEQDFSEDKILAAGITKRYLNINLEKCLEEIKQLINKY